MAARVVRNCFDRFQRARMDFVSEVADLAQKPHYLECLLDEGAVVALKKLLHDKVRRWTEFATSIRYEALVTSSCF